MASPTEGTHKDFQTTRNAVPDSGPEHPDVHDFLSRLNHLLHADLPGKEAQLRMAHMTRLQEVPVRNDVRTAAVLITLYPKGHKLHTVLIRRRMISGDIHGGQISFPGGRSEALETPLETALREAQEEIGLAPDTVRLIGQLTELYIPVSNHLVYPVVVSISGAMQWTPQPSEVESIIEVPVSTLVAPETRTSGPIRLSDGLVLHDVPYYSVHGHAVWGATAMILSELCEVLGRSGHS